MTVQVNNKFTSSYTELSSVVNWKSNTHYEVLAQNCRSILGVPLVVADVAAADDDEGDDADGSFGRLGVIEKGSLQLAMGKIE